LRCGVRAPLSAHLPMTQYSSKQRTHLFQTLPPPVTPHPAHGDGACRSSHC
jgi:hypothetical protein